MTVNDKILILKESPVFWAGVALSVLLLIFIHFEGLSLMVSWWESREEYGHGFMIPFITAFLIEYRTD